MSAKGGKRISRKATSESMEDSNKHATEDSADSCKLNGSKTENDEQELKGFSESEINGTKHVSDELVKEISESEESKQESQNEPENGEQIATEEKQVNGVEEAINGEDITEENGIRNEAEIEHDEPEPELQFDENSDIESVKNASPVVSRCTTRRSQVRNVPTPKTPKLILQELNEEEPPSQESEETNEEPHVAENGVDESTDSFTSTIADDMSTRAEVGSDTTRINFTAHEISDSPFMKTVREKSFSDTLRRLSIRPSLRSARDLPTIKKSDFPYPKRASVESVKRKKRSVSPEDSKRFKREGSGSIFSYITSPVLNMRNRLSDRIVPSSTPKLTGFRNKNSLLDSEEISKIKLDVDERVEEKKWCMIM